MSFVVLILGDLSLQVGNSGVEGVRKHPLGLHLLTVPDSLDGMVELLGFGGGLAC